MSIKIIDVLENNTYKKLKKLEFFENFQPKKGLAFFLHENNNDISYYPMLPIRFLYFYDNFIFLRNIVNKNEFIKYSEVSSEIHEIFGKTPNKSSKKIIKTETENSNSLQIKKPFYLSDKKKLNSVYCKDNEKKQSSLKFNEKKRFSLPNNIYNKQHIKESVNIVKLHSEGYTNKKNYDLFQHLYRLMLKRKVAVLKKKKFSTFSINSPSPVLKKHKLEVIEIKYAPLKTKEFLLKKSLFDICIYEKIIENFEINMGVSIIKPTLQNEINIINFNSENLKNKNEERLFFEEVFIFKLLEKVNLKGLSSLHIAEISQFKKIINERKNILLQLEKDLENIGNNLENNNKLAYIPKISNENNSKTNKNAKLDNYASTTIINKSNLSSIKLSCTNNPLTPKKKKFSFFDTKKIESNQIDNKIHSNSKKTNLLKVDGLLKPLIYDPNNEVQYEGNKKIEEIGIKLEVLKKKIVERLQINDDTNNIDELIGKNEGFVREKIFKKRNSFMPTKTIIKKIYDNKTVEVKNEEKHSYLSPIP